MINQQSLSFYGQISTMRNKGYNIREISKALRTMFGKNVPTRRVSTN